MKWGFRGDWVAGGGWFGRRTTGDGVSVVGEVDAGGGWRWVCVFGCLGVWGGEGRRRGKGVSVRPLGKNGE
jgi:hypothetical protein